MGLHAITLSVDAASCSDSGPTEARGEAACAFCGVRSSRWMGCGWAGSARGQHAAPPACPLCVLPQHLERRRIDEEAALVWLPEISQQALNAILREIHVALQALGEALHADAVLRKRLPQLRDLHYARAILAERGIAAATRAGTASPRELGLALLDLSPAAYARRGELLGGLRLMPLGRFFQDGQDIYPQIIAAWRGPAAIAPLRRDGAP